MTLAQLARKFGQAIAPVRISVSDGNEFLGNAAPPPSPNGPRPAPVEGAFAPGHMLDLEFVERTDVGRVRDHNEDSLGHAAPASPAQIGSHGWLFVLADGVGGQEKGEVASKTAVESVLAGFYKAKDGEPHSAVLQKLVQQANSSILEAAVTGGRSSARMATTIVACALRYDRASVAHVGDSRCYLIRGGKATQVTRDHTIANEQVRLGLVSAQDAAGSDTSHILSRSLGTELVANVDTNDHQIFAGDVLLLCSDGLHNYLEGAEMAAICGQGQDLSHSADRLVALANDR